jgi:hypothetical protein
MSHAIGVVSPQTLVSRLRCSLSDFASPTVLHCYKQTLSEGCKRKMTDYHPVHSKRPITRKKPLPL